MTFVVRRFHHMHVHYATKHKNTNNKKQKLDAVKLNLGNQLDADSLIERNLALKCAMEVATIDANLAKLKLERIYHGNIALPRAQRMMVTSNKH